MAKLELYGTAQLPLHQEMREWLEWKASEFVEYDVEADPAARERMRDVGQRAAHRARCWSKTARSCRSAGRDAAASVEWSEHDRAPAPFGYAAWCRASASVRSCIAWRAPIRSAGWVLKAKTAWRFIWKAPSRALQAFLRELKTQPPPAASIAAIETSSRRTCGFERIHDSREPAAGAADGAHLAGPAGLRRLPARTLRSARSALPLSLHQLHQLRSALHRRPAACPTTGPTRRWRTGRWTRTAPRNIAIPRTAAFTRSRWRARRAGRIITLQPAKRDRAGKRSEPFGTRLNCCRAGKIVAVKGLGGYHLACDARNAAAVAALRERKYRKEKPFALMAGTSTSRAAWWSFHPEAEALLTSAARPIVLAPAKSELAGVAPGKQRARRDAALHAAASSALRRRRAGNSGDDQRQSLERADRLRGRAMRSQRLSGIADAFLIGERPIARRVDDSVARAGAFGPVILRRARGYAPGAVATLPASRPILALGADLKNTITLVVDGQAFVSQHIGDLDHYECVSRVSAKRFAICCRCTKSTGTTAGGARRASAVCLDGAARLELPAAPGRSPCSIIARTSRPCWRSAARGTSA